MAVAWMPGLREWQVASVEAGTAELAEKLKTSHLVAQTLYNRGVRDLEQAQVFLNPKLSYLHDPEMLHGAAEAAQKIAAMVASGGKIVIYGDYDVDGMTAVSILHACLKLLGANVSYYVPHRIEEGYGLNSQAVEKLIADGAKMIITVDCGINAIDEANIARRAGVEMIITDHHGLGDTLPEASSIVHPAMGDYPNPHLCGAGVAMKLAWQIARACGGERRVDERMRNFLLDATCMAALGTIADVVPLTGENRVLAIFGLKGLQGTKHTGLKALLASADLDNKQLDAYHVGFVLGPRLNACGRMGHAGLAVELLTEAPREKCDQIAEHLKEQNAQRQKVEREILEQALEEVRRQGLDDPSHKIITLWGDDWHGGVIGIVASRIVDQFGKPAILIANNGDGLGHGSGRSIPGFDMRAALEACGSHLLSFGGHAMAGGLRIEPTKLEAFAEAIGRYALDNINDKQLALPLTLDAHATLAELTPLVVNQLESLSPFGQGNPPPRFMFCGCEVMTPPKRMGRGGRAVQFFVGQDKSSVRVVGFSMGDLADSLQVGSRIDLAAQPAVNRFNGNTSLQLVLADVQFS